MTNGEKFKTAQERAAAFTKFCYQKQRTNSRYCEYHGENHCPICTMTWLDLEAEEEKPLPCPFCGSVDLGFRTSQDGFCAAVCECGYSTQYYKIKTDAIAAHNRVAKAVKEGEAK